MSEASTKLIFRSSIHYDRTIAQLAGVSLADSAEQELDALVADIQSTWEQYNDSLFSYFASCGFTLPEAWYVYPIHSNGKITSFAEPTTIVMREDIWDVISTLVHEISHVFCSFDENDAVVSPTWGKISHTFHDEDMDTKAHILINVLTRAGLRHILGPEKAEELLKLEKEYEGLKRAWQIIDKSKSTAYDEPLKFLEELAEENKLSL